MAAQQEQSARFEPGLPVLEGRFETFADTMDAAALQFASSDAYVEGVRRIDFHEWRELTAMMKVDKMALRERAKRLPQACSSSVP